MADDEAEGREQGVVMPMHLVLPISIRLAALLLLAIGSPFPLIASADAQDQAELERVFETRIRPLLAEHCLKCHGESDQKSGLRLDSREAALRGGDLGPAVVPNDPGESLLITAITHADEFLKMPPGAEMLPDEIIHDLTEWVQTGAYWPESTSANPTEATTPDVHWAFQPVRQLEPPLARNAGTTHDPIDAFIQTRLDAEGLSFSSEADRRTLIRRLSFDLTGLPPTPDEIEAFVNDDAPDAYDRVVDRLLASQHYGERWGRHWLDVARYADTKGYVFQEERRYPFAYTYRDYVIRAFNEDKPYDQFILEQLAADQLPDDGDPADLAAMGFLTVGRRFLNKQDDILDDRIDVTTRGLLGLTVACARCHDHKYDPIPAADYYSLYGVFASSEEPEDLPLLVANLEDASEDYLAKRQARIVALQAYLDSKRADFTEALTSRLGDFLGVAVELNLEPGHPDFDTFTRETELHPRLLRLVMQRWKAWTGTSAGVADPLLGPWNALSNIVDRSEFASKLAELTNTLDAELASGPAADPTTRRIVRREVLGGDPPNSRVELARRYGALLGRAATEPNNPDLAPLRVRLESPESPNTLPADAKAFARLFERDERNKLRELERDVAQVDANHPEAPPKAMVLVDKETLYDPYVFQRGNPGRRGQAVPRRFLKILSDSGRTPFQNGSGRLELAQAIASPENPLTARVLVNRVWMHHFGQPLVNSPSDFGLRSDPPSHPELLDWLAATFVEDGWSIKSLHRRIVHSRAYRQQSLDRPECLAIDPENTLFWKQNRKRLELEPLRDAMLAVSGQLDRTMGGRPVDIIDQPFTTRRTVYALIDRQNLPGLFRTFDLASPNASSPRRFETTVPQQALFLMNSPFVAEQARHLARRATREASNSPEAAIQALYGSLFGREAANDEVDAATRFLSHRHGIEPEFEAGWTYGYGAFNTSSGRVSSFTPFPMWSAGTWKFGDQLPDPEFHFLHLKSDGGHVGHTEDRAVILRWTAPQAGEISIELTISHESDQGDGVRTRVVAGHHGPLCGSLVHHEQTVVRVEKSEVRAGETIDFVVDCRSNHDFDAFRWAPMIRLVDPSPGDVSVSAWDARKEFHGPLPLRLDSLARLAQVLLLTNEFAFVD